MPLVLYSFLFSCRERVVDSLGGSLKYSRGIGVFDGMIARVIWEADNLKSFDSFISNQKIRQLEHQLFKY